MIWFVFACVLSISSSYPGSSLSLPLSLLSQSHQSLTRSVIERKQTKENLWWHKHRRTSSNKKLFCGHFTRSSLVHKRPCPWRVFLGVFKGNPVLVWWNVHRDTANKQTAKKIKNTEAKTQRKQKALDVLSWKHRTII